MTKKAYEPMTVELWRFDDDVKTDIINASKDCGEPDIDWGL